MTLSAETILSVHQVLSIEDVNTYAEPEIFVQALASRFSTLIDNRGSMGKLESVGLEVLQTTAGSDYRRKLVKRMAIAALEEI